MAVNKLPRTPEQIPVYNTIRADTAPSVTSIVTELERGVFQNAALLADGMMRDDRIAAVLHTRTSALASLPLDIRPANQKRMAKNAAADLSTIWNKIFPDWMLAQLIQWGQLLGVAAARVTWEDDEEYGTLPKLEIWHPKHIRWDWLDRTYYAYHTQGEEPITPGDGWLLYTPNGKEYGWRRSLLLSLANLWLMRQWTWRDWARASEVYAIPIRKAFVPSDAKQEEKDDFLREIASLGNESAIKLPRPKEGPGFDVELVEVEGDMHKAFSDFIDALNSSIAITVLGQNLSTEVKGGSFAAAQAHEQVRADRLGADAETMSCALFEQVIQEWTLRVYGRADMAPYPQWEFEPPADKFSKTQYMVTLSQAITQFQSANAPIDLRAMLDQFDIPTLPIEETPEPIAEVPGTPTEVVPPAEPATPEAPTEAPRQ